MAKLQKITPFLWYDHQAEQAAAFYTSIFPNSRIAGVSHFGEEGKEQHGRPPASVMVVSFELDGQAFHAMNGGPNVVFNWSVSFMVNCDTQEEVDYYWEKLGQGGDPQFRQCGWVQDQFGLSWQIIPNVLMEMVGHPADPRSERAMAAMLRMKKIDIAQLHRAYDGQ
jgi:predicted 3-demethylubiquinone-9 3-methyltransferase (glyoxalase superfamily)